MIQLSNRQNQVLNLLAQGKKDREIAVEMNVTVNTVRGYVTEIFNKLGVTNRTEAAAWAIRRSLD